LEAQADDPLARFSDPSAVWGNGIESVIEEAYRQCFKTRIIGGRIINIRMPFAENHERDFLADSVWEFYGGGKANPEILWPVIEKILDSPSFDEYISALSSGRERVFIFDIARQSWSYSIDLFDLARLKAGSYRGLPHKPYVLASGQGVTESDIYNYLYCVGLVGMDCSGFVWHVLSWIAKRGNLDLGAVLIRVLGLPRRADAAWYAGTSFFNSKNAQITAVNDEIRSLRPADIILFPDRNGGAAHSAVIQSVDYTTGTIRYLQCTDEAPLSERGVHESFIHFNPASPSVSLSEPSLVWTQKRYAPFPGEKDSPFSDDGGRYRAYTGGKVVRMSALAPVIDMINKGR
jgi:hypothetical protein